MSLTNVIFDLFGTLVDDFMSSGGEMLPEMAAALELRYEQFTPLWNQTAETRIIGTFDTVEANIDYVCRAMNVSPGAEQIRKAVEIRMKYVKQALRPRADALETLSQLKHDAYKIGLLSNCSIEIPMLWEETAFANLINAPTFSCRARLKKPDIRIYNLACERLGVAPDSCLYIAAGEDHELAAAAKVGLHPVLIRPPSQKTHSESHQEANEWQGATIARLPEVLQLVRR
jgi:putative hydrolase of the HAD superfamily